MRATSAVARHQRIKKIRKNTKGMGRARRASHRLGRQAVVRSMQYQYRDRRNKKRDFRKLWITRINAAARQHGMSYSVFMDKLNKANITLNRKTLAELAVNEPSAFAEIAKTVK